MAMNAQGKSAAPLETGRPEYRTKTLWVREPYLSQILAGRKTVEVRVGYDNILRLRPGDHLRLNDKHLFTIRRIGRYADFEEMVAAEDPATIAPDLPPDQLLDAIRAIYPPEKEDLGAIALELATSPRAERRYDAILFDMGYTLIHFEPAQEIIAQEALRAAGAERSTAEIGAAVEAVWGRYYRDAESRTFPPTEEYDRQSQARLERGFLAHLGLDTSEDTLKKYGDAIESWFSQPGVMRTYAEVVEVLEALRERGYRLGIVSNWSWNLRERVAQVSLEGHFEIVWASAYAGCNKPHPGIFRQALAQMELAPDRVLYVGDSYRHDVVGARNANVDAVLLDREGSAGDVDCSVISDLWGVMDLLKV
jgi:putative hydrolase of the HAD superfamily